MKTAIIAGGIIATLFVGGCTANNTNQGSEKIGVNRPTDVNYPTDGNFDRAMYPNGAQNVRNNINYDTRNVTNNNDTRNVANNNDTRNVANNNDIREGNNLSAEIDKLKEVKQSTVMVMGNSAYVAADLSDKGSNELAKNVEEKIADKVRAADASIENVYVSSNPDFIDRMQGYSNDVRNGHPIAGFADEFTETMKRVFPSAH